MCARFYGRLSCALFCVVFVGEKTRATEKLAPGFRVSGKVPVIFAVNAVEPTTAGCCGIVT